MTLDPAFLKEAEAAALVALLRHGVTADVQEQLTHGDGRGTVPPGALAAMIAAIFADMPTIGEDPAGKGYPCFFRPMTPAEAKTFIERLQRDIAEADRRAGAAERRLAHADEESGKHSRWRREAKAAAGVSDSVSFDHVWAEALAALLEKRAQPPAIDGMPAMDHGMRTTPGYAAEQLKGRGMVGLTLNLRRLQEWLDLYEVRAKATPESDRSAWDWLADQRTLELSYHRPTYGDDDDLAEEWRVTRVSGSINDREWTTIGRGASPLAAVEDAREGGK